MPVVKQSHNDPSFRSAVVLDLGDLRRQADAIKVEAQRQAEAIINRSAEQARDLHRGAAEKGFAEGRLAGYEEGHSAGLQEGRDEALKMASEQLQSVIEQWEKSLDDFEESRAAILSQAREDVLRLALEIAQKLVEWEGLRCSDGALQQAAKAIALISEPSRLTLCVHPEDIDLLRENLPVLQQRFTVSEHIELVADEMISRGGCVVRYGRGLIDATLETQMRRIVDALLPEETANGEPGNEEPDTEPTTP